MTARVRRGLLGGAVVALTLSVAGCGQSTTGAAATGGTSTTAAVTTTTSAAPLPTTGSAQCDYTATPGQPAPAGHQVGIPPNTAPRAGTVNVTLHTSQGDIPITMPRAKAPCTVASFAYLAGKNYFNSTPCHRLNQRRLAESAPVRRPDRQRYRRAPATPSRTRTRPTCPQEPAARRSTPGAPSPWPTPANRTAAAASSSWSTPTPNCRRTTRSSARSARRASRVLDKIAAAGVGSGGQGPQDGPPATPVTITSATASAS